MAKKFVRGITDVKTITNQDFDTNNVNDLLSDGQYNYIHRKKGKNEEYHNLTDNIKTLSSDNTELLAVTNYNKTTNTATLHPKHDAQKEQVLEAGNSTINIEHGTNSTSEKTKIKVADGLVDKINNKQDKLTAGDGLSIDSNNITIKPKRLEDLTATNGLYFGNVAKDGLPYTAISLSTDYNKHVQMAFRESANSSGKIVAKYRFMNNNTPTQWNEMLVDDATIRGLLAQKQNQLSGNQSIGITLNNSLRVLYTSKQKYTHSNGILKTHVEWLTNNTDPSGEPEEQFHFTLKINQGQQSATFTLNEQDKTHFSKIMTAYGVNSSVRINGCLFTLSDTTLTVSTDGNTGSNLVITFSDILD